MKFSPWFFPPIGLGISFEPVKESLRFFFIGITGGFHLNFMHGTYIYRRGTIL